jgi:hypothetical protein
MVNAGFDNHLISNAKSRQFHDSGHPDHALLRFLGWSYGIPAGPDADLGAAILIVPVSWTYFITSRSKEVDQSFVQTIIIMPIVVTGISMIVMNSIPLAFSLAGIVAAVRFRFTLRQPGHAMYIFVAISVGLGAGIGALGISAVISAAFVFATLIIWKLEYGKILSGPFFSMLTRRDRTEEEY